MTDTNSKAQVTDAMVNAADSVLSRSRPGIPDEIIALAIAAALAAQEKPEPGVVALARKVAENDVGSGEHYRAVCDLRRHFAAPSPDLPEGEASR